MKFNCKRRVWIGEGGGGGGGGGCSGDKRSGFLISIFFLKKHTCFIYMEKSLIDK